MPLRHNIINLLVRILKIYVYINITSVLRAFALPVENGADSDHFFQITGQNFDENLVKNSTQNSNSTIYSTPNPYTVVLQKCQENGLKINKNDLLRLKNDFFRPVLTYFDPKKISENQISPQNVTF